jgi:hypothetical protein
MIADFTVRDLDALGKGAKVVTPMAAAVDPDALSGDTVAARRLLASHHRDRKTSRFGHHPQGRRLCGGHSRVHRKMSGALADTSGSWPSWPIDDPEHARALRSGAV